MRCGGAAIVLDAEITCTLFVVMDCIKLDSLTINYAPRFTGDIRNHAIFGPGLAQSYAIQQRCGCPSAYGVTEGVRNLVSGAPVAVQGGDVRQRRYAGTSFLFFSRRGCLFGRSDRSLRWNRMCAAR